MRVTGQPALVMQVKPYRETSAITQLFTPNAGRISCVVRGVRRRRNPYPGLQPFNEVTVSYSGRGGLQTLHNAELSQAHVLDGDYLAGGFYMFELIARLLREHDGHPRLYAVVVALIERLQPPEPLPPLLRVFERRLLEEIGFGIEFDRASDGVPVAEDGRYNYAANEGFEASPRGDYAGSTLLAIAADDYSEPQTRAAARRVFRAALQPHIGSKPLASRALLKMSSGSP